MDSTPRQIDYYETDEGKRPFIEWLEEQDRGVQARIVTRFKHLEQGNLGKHRVKGEGVFALILDFGPGYRIYNGLTENQKVVLLLTGDGKKRQDQDIKLARAYWKDYKKG